MVYVYIYLLILSTYKYIIRFLSVHFYYGPCHSAASARKSTHPKSKVELGSTMQNGQNGVHNSYWPLYLTGSILSLWSFNCVGSMLAEDWIPFRPNDSIPKFTRRRSESKGPHGRMYTFTARNALGRQHLHGLEFASLLEFGKSKSRLYTLSMYSQIAF